MRISGTEPSSAKQCNYIKVEKLIHVAISAIFFNLNILSSVISWFIVFFDFQDNSIWVADSHGVGVSKSLVKGLGSLEGSVQHCVNLDLKAPVSEMEPSQWWKYVHFWNFENSHDKAFLQEL